MKQILFSTFIFIIISCKDRPKYPMNEIEGENGNKYLLQLDKKTIIALNNKDQKIWSANVIDFCGNPTIGKAEIRNIKKSKNELHITYGKHEFASINVNNGNIKCLGAD